MSLWSRISNTVHGERLNREIDEELQSHIEEAIASGRDPKEARRAFGCALHAREASHSIRVVGWLESLIADISFGWRQLCRNKVTSVAAVLSLALTIGSCVAAFRLIDALLWRPLPLSHDRLNPVWRNSVSIATGWSEPVPGREFHPLKSSAFHGALLRQQSEFRDRMARGEANDVYRNGVICTLSRFSRDHLDHVAR